MNSRSLTAFPKSGITPNLTFNSGSQNRKVRAAKWGNSSCAAKILTRACRLGVKGGHSAVPAQCPVCLRADMAG
jgi:hypothetical protein